MGNDEQVAPVDQHLMEIDPGRIRSPQKSIRVDVLLVERPPHGFDGKHRVTELCPEEPGVEAGGATAWAYCQKPFQSLATPDECIENQGQKEWYRRLRLDPPREASG